MRGRVRSARDQTLSTQRRTGLSRSAWLKLEMASCQAVLFTDGGSTASLYLIGTNSLFISRNEASGKGALMDVRDLFVNSVEFGFGAERDFDRAALRTTQDANFRPERKAQAVFGCARMHIVR
jgi:hypothetical protein